MSRFLLATSVAVLLFAGPAFAADENPLPPPNAKKLSEIIAKVEQRNGFRYVKEVDWDKDGYTVIYYTSDKAKVEIVFDPVTAEPK
ncbi:PepSY domain-containing protein [Mesorhizobium sp. B2-1-8]|uniref:PepSY domain-containing protein n=1 Tax=Mesorhizobium sp. B2-1-8 TaxID=2589967 RepID=UPI00112AD840|nr:PepSY domain-containing protein [Mesorhizobium sp. B2-1-8]UCI17387.1 PepSY domain-containing protein [Mesorhizobium sp. B2-1-8]